MSLQHSRTPSRRVDPILGTEKRCGTCGEWWPLDEEFWYVKRYQAGDIAYAAGKSYIRQSSGEHWYSRCRACWADRSAAAYAARRAS